MPKVTQLGSGGIKVYTKPNQSQFYYQSPSLYLYFMTLFKNSAHMKYSINLNLQ